MWMRRTTNETTLLVLIFTLPYFAGCSRPMYSEVVTLKYDNIWISTAGPVSGNTFDRIRLVDANDCDDIHIGFTDGSSIPLQELTPEIVAKRLPDAISAGDVEPNAEFFINNQSTITFSNKRVRVLLMNSDCPFRLIKGGVRIELPASRSNIEQALGEPLQVTKSRKV